MNPCKFFFTAGWSALVLLFSFVASVMPHQAQAAVTWEEQAERLQNVSATLLDAAPVSVVQPSGLVLAAGGVFSLLPEVNPQVGSKQEKVPSSPLHGVPSLQLSYGLDFEIVRAGVRTWGGYLPSGLESLFGVDAELSQWSFGAAVAAGFALGMPPFVGGPGVELGWQTTTAAVKGAITAVGASDQFDSTTEIIYISAGLHPRTLGLHAALLVGLKNTKSEFVVPNEGTRLKLEDRLSDASPPAFFQAQLGWKMPFGLMLGLAEIWVPDRLMMPRVFAQYEHSL